MKKNIRKNKGITLIALVITIIVLLILTGITIASLTGENGLLSRSSEARNSQNKAQIQEELQLIVMESMTEQNGYVASEVAAKIQGSTANGDSVTGTYKGYSFSINSTGKVTVRGENEDEYCVYIDFSTYGVEAFLVKSEQLSNFDENGDPSALTTFSEAYIVKDGSRINVSSWIQSEEEDGTIIVSYLILPRDDSSSPLYNYEGDYDIILIKDGKEYTYSYQYVDPINAVIIFEGTGIKLDNSSALASYILFEEAYIVIDGTRKSLEVLTYNDPMIEAYHPYSYIDLTTIDESLGANVGQEYEFILVKNGKEYSINATIPSQREGE